MTEFASDQPGRGGSSGTDKLTEIWNYYEFGKQYNNAQNPNQYAVAEKKHPVGTAIRQGVRNM